jgi:hypothetical protein
MIDGAEGADFFSSDAFYVFLLSVSTGSLKRCAEIPGVPLPTQQGPRGF